MPFQLSPGVAVVEKDFTSIVPAVATSGGAFAGNFTWGPVLDPVTIISENNLVERFGKPTENNFQSFFSAANFLSYSGNLLVVRADSADGRNAVAVPSGTISAITVSIAGSGYDSLAAAPSVSIAAPQTAGGVNATATAVLSGGTITAVPVSDGGSGYTTAAVSFSAPQRPGGVTATGTVTITGDAITAIVITNAGSGYTAAPTVTITGDGTGVVTGTPTVSGSTIINVVVTNAGSGYTVAPTVTITGPGGGGTQATAEATVAAGGIKINNQNDYLQNFVNGAGLVGEWAAKYPGALGNSLKVSIADSVGFSSWAYASEFDSAPGTSTYGTSVGVTGDEVHVIIVDEDGLWTGTQGAILEKFAYVSKASDSRKSDGTNNYYRDVINSQSKYIWWMDHPTSVGAGHAFGSAAAGKTGAYANLTAPVTRSLDKGVDSTSVSDGNLMTAYNIFANDELYDISLIVMGKASATVVNSVFTNVVDTRLDCVMFASPQDVSTGEVIQGTGSDVTSKMKAYRNALPSTSYAVLDSGFKYQYDRYNDKYRWIPLNGDVAGLCARTDYTNDPWFSPGGLNRGQIKNVVKLAAQLTKADRDELYKVNINPVVTFPGQGTVLFGDKTLLAKPSAFDRINVRRLFIVLEKAIATAAKFQLFEFNDGFTRAQFKNLVEPFLRDVQGRRGITDFVVKCDEANNTGEVIDRNEFVADIFIKPNRSINFITLNFVAARSSINFSEIGA
jgi:hypothetical protein